MRPLAFVLAASDHGLMIVNHLDEHRLPDGSPYGVGSQVLRRGAYDPGEMAHMESLLRSCQQRAGDGVVMLDCGANIGVNTIVAAKLMTHWGTVLAFEAQERIFYALAGNIAVNNCFNATARHAAVGKDLSVIDIPKPNYTLPGSFGSLELRRVQGTEFIGQTIDYGPKATVTVPMISIDGLELPRCDFIKIDVEGMEPEVLVGAKDTISRCRPIMLIEWIKCGTEVVKDALGPLGYNIRRAGGNNVVAVPK